MKLRLAYTTDDWGNESVSPTENSRLCQLVEEYLNQYAATVPYEDGEESVRWEVIAANDQPADAYADVMGEGDVARLPADTRNAIEQAWGEALRTVFA